MLLRLHVKGFKNLLDVDVRFGPFTCIFGENGVGKSNLFDAIRLLSLLAEGMTFPAATQAIRVASGRSARASTLFTRLGGWSSESLSLQADMLVARENLDDFGNPAEAAARLLRYRLVLGLEGARIKLLEESLERIAKLEGKDLLSPLGAAADFVADASQRRTPFMRTDGGVVKTAQDGHQGNDKSTVVEKAPKTVLGAQEDGQFPTVLAARREMQSWTRIALEPSSMRSPSRYNDPDRVDEDGAHLAATLHRIARLEDDHEAVFARVANRLHALLPEVQRVHLEDDKPAEEWTVIVTMHDGVAYPTRALSDGTLRFLVMAVLAEDPQANDVLCLEEPENGIHPDRVDAMTRLLRDIGSPPASPEERFRQVIVNTHSPVLYQAVPEGDRVWLRARRVTREDGAGAVAGVYAERGTWRVRLGAEELPPGESTRWQQMRFAFDQVAEE